MKTTRLEALQKILATLRSNPISGLKPSYAVSLGEEEARPTHGLSLEWERAWGVSADLSVQLWGEIEQRPTRGTMGTRHFQPEQRLRTFKPQVRVSWSSTGRTTASARAAVVLYSQVVDLAALVEAQLGSMEIEEVLS